MFIIKNLSNNTIDLTNINEYSNDFEIFSFNDNEKIQPYYIEYISNEGISLTKFDTNFLNVTIDIEAIIENEYFILKNLIGERLTINIKPNENYIRDKTFKFKITKQEFKEDNILKLKILSKMNDDEIGWKCTYDGKPISYQITPMESNQSSYVTIKLMANMINDFISTIIFKQDGSGRIIKYHIKNTPNGMEKAS